MHEKLSFITYTSSGTAVFFGLTANEFAALVGACIAVLSFFVNLGFKIYEVRRRK